MSREAFITVMRIVHDSLYQLHSPSNKDEADVLKNLINAYISMIAGFDQKLYEILRTWLTSHKEASDDDFGSLYDALTVPAADVTN